MIHRPESGILRQRQRSWEIADNVVPKRRMRIADDQLYYPIPPDTNGTTYESILISITQEPVHVLIIHHMVREVQNSEIESVISGFVEYDLTYRCQLISL